MDEKKQVLVIQTIVPPEIILPDCNQDPQLKSGPTVMLTFLTVLDGTRVGISNYIGLVCESCA